MPEISIIIPTLNEEVGMTCFLSKLQPLRSQCELIVVDGGSGDNTVQLAEYFVDEVVRSDPGRALQMNVGAAFASSPVVLFLHADTYLPDDAVGQIQQAMEHGYRWGRFDIKLTGNHPMLAIVAWLMNLRSYSTGIVTGDQALFVETELFEQLNGFAEIALMEDIEFSSRLKHQGRPYNVKSKVTSSGRRWISFGVFKTIVLMWWLRLQYFFDVSPRYLAQLYKEGRFWKA
jgi:rSAM/selenodomain-associated transferase 2